MIHPLGSNRTPSGTPSQKARDSTVAQLVIFISSIYSLTRAAVKPKLDSSRLIQDPSPSFFLTASKQVVANKYFGVKSILDLFPR